MDNSDTTTDITTSARGSENGRSSGSASGSSHSDDTGSSNLDVNANGSGSGSSNSSSSQTTLIRSPNFASRESVKSTLGGSGSLSSSGHMKQADGETSRDGSYSTNQSGQGTVSVSNASNSHSGNTFQFATLVGTLTNGSSLGGSGSYTVAAGSGGASSQKVNVDSTATAKIESRGAEGASTRTDTSTGQTWEGTLIKSSENGSGRTTSGGNVEIDENGNVTGTLNHSENGSGTSSDTYTNYSGRIESWYDPIDNTATKDSRFSRRTDTYTTTSKNTEDSQASTDTHEWAVNSGTEFRTTRTYSDYPYDEVHRRVNGWTSDRSTGTHTTTVSVSGDQASALINYNSAYRNAWGTFTFQSGIGPDSQYQWDSDETTSSAGTNSYAYSSTHSLDADGRAVGGRFSASGNRSDTAGSYNIYYDQSEGFNGEYHHSYDSIIRENEFITSSQTSSESGSYEDGPNGRVQSGSYSVVTISDSRWEKDWQKTEEPLAHVDGFGRIRESDVTKIEQTGSYGPDGGTDEVSRSRDYSYNGRDQVYNEWESAFDSGWGRTDHFVDKWFRVSPGQAPDGWWTERWEYSGDPEPTEEPPEPIDQPWFGGAGPVAPAATTNAWTGSSTADSLIVPVSDVAPRPEPSDGGGFWSVPDVPEAEVESVPPAEEEQGWIDWFTDFIPFVSSSKKIVRGSEGIDRELNRSAREEYLNDLSYDRDSASATRPYAVGAGLGKAKQSVEGLFQVGIEFNGLAPSLAGAAGAAGVPKKGSGNFSKPKAVSVDKLSRAASALDQNGLSAAGRALQKHSGRPGSAFAPVTGPPSNWNAAAQAIVDDILTNPGSTFTSSIKGRFGKVINVVAPDGRGVRFSADGSFIGFLEP